LRRTFCATANTWVRSLKQWSIWWLNRQDIEQDLPPEVAKILKLRFVGTLAEVIDGALSLKLQKQNQAAPALVHGALEPRAAQATVLMNSASFPKASAIEDSVNRLLNNSTD
jgi:hypothetical protein